MKTLTMLMIVMATAGWTVSYGQVTEADVPGDNFSLEGALELFKKSSSPQEFEELLNSPDSKVNNLDLNGDGYIDYIRVFDRQEGNVHVFILQAVISDTESQDVAVIELEKKANGKAVLQIIGDEDLYGIETIIEPTREVRTYAGTTVTPVAVNVWAWPCVQFIYGPVYVGWISPWSWHLRPVWWHPWRPVAYVYYAPIWHPYYPHYTVCHTRRVVYAHHIYYPHRTTSVVVHKRYHASVAHYRSAYPQGRQRGGDMHHGNHYRQPPAGYGSRSAQQYNRNHQQSVQNGHDSGHHDAHGRGSDNQGKRNQRSDDFNSRPNGVKSGQSSSSNTHIVGQPRAPKPGTVQSTTSRNNAGRQTGTSWNSGDVSKQRSSSGNTGTPQNHNVQRPTRQTTANNDRTSIYNSSRQSSSPNNTIRHQQTTPAPSRTPSVNTSRSSGSVSAPSRSGGSVHRSTTPSQSSSRPSSVSRSSSSGNSHSGGHSSSGKSSHTRGRQ